MGRMWGPGRRERGTVQSDNWGYKAPAQFLSLPAHFEPPGALPTFGPARPRDGIWAPTWPAASAGVSAWSRNAGQMQKGGTPSRDALLVKHAGGPINRQQTLETAPSGVSFQSRPRAGASREPCSRSPLLSWESSTGSSTFQYPPPPPAPLLPSHLFIS